jgi:nicotinamide mononucleotide adenylyltransferase
MGSDRANPGAPNPNGSGCRAKTLARVSDMLECRFLTIRNLSPKSGKWHFRESRFKNFPHEHALDPHIRSSTRAFGTSTKGAFENFEQGPPDITSRP